MQKRAVTVLEVHHGTRELKEVLRDVEKLRRAKEGRSDKCRYAPFTRE